MPIKAKWCIKT